MLSPTSPGRDVDVPEPSKPAADSTPSRPAAVASPLSPKRGSAKASPRFGSKGAAADKTGKGTPLLARISQGVKGVRSVLVQRRSSVRSLRNEGKGGADADEFPLPDEIAEEDEAAIASVAVAAAARCESDSRFTFVSKFFLLTLWERALEEVRAKSRNGLDALVRGRLVLGSYSTTTRVTISRCREKHSEDVVGSYFREVEFVGLSIAEVFESTNLELTSMDDLVYRCVLLSVAS